MIKFYKKIMLIYYLVWLLFINSVCSPPHCPPQINEKIQQCVFPVANYAKSLNQQVAHLPFALHFYKVFFSEMQ